MVVNLKQPWIAAFLAWLVPGLGHYYQGRYFKSFLFSICIIPTFLVGAYLGSSPEVGFARNVYCSWRPGDKRYFFVPQSCIGLVAIPAIMQSYIVDDGKIPFLNGAMAPPDIPRSARHPMRDETQWNPLTLNEIIAKLGNRFEIGTLFTVIAGLMNLLVIFDAFDGPFNSRKEEPQE